MKWNLHILKFTHLSTQDVVIRTPKCGHLVCQVTDSETWKLLTMIGPQFPLLENEYNIYLSEPQETANAKGFCQPQSVR